MSGTTENDDEFLKGSSPQKGEGHFSRTKKSVEIIFVPHRTLTPPETNIAPENRVSQKESHLPTIHFQGLC